MKDHLFDDDSFQEPPTGPPLWKAKPSFMDASSLYGSLYVIGFEFGHSAAGAFAPVCKIEADHLESDKDFDQLIEALQKAKASLRQLKQQSASPTQQ
jgi:uncharacterized protein (DUF488 family)